MTDSGGVSNKILVVEDEPHLAFSLKFNLEAEGFFVEVVANGRHAIERFGQSQDYSLVILDGMLPEVDGVDVAKFIRAKTPTMGVLMLTARAGDQDRVAGFEAGVDDYLTKPFNLQELLLRVKRMSQRAQLLKSAKGSPAAPGASIMKVGEIELNTELLLLTTTKGSHNLTALEANIMAEFMRHPNRVLSRDYLLQKVWGMSAEVETRTVDNFIVRLRRFLEEEPAAPKHLVSVRGRGYRLVVP